MRFNPKARLDPAASRTPGRAGGGGGLAAVAGGSRSPAARPAADRRHPDRGLIIVLIQCLAGGDGAAVAPAATALAPRRPGRHRPLRPAARPARTPTRRRLRPGRRRELADRLLGGRCGRPTFRPEEQIVTFTGSVNTGCGGATSAVGPFYCPADERSTSTPTSSTRCSSASSAAPTAASWSPTCSPTSTATTSEPARHIGKVRTQQGPQSDAVRLELQADCYAGMWARTPPTPRTPSGNVLISELTDEDVDLALEAAAASATTGSSRRPRARSPRSPGPTAPPSSGRRGSAPATRRASCEACDTFAVGPGLSLPAEQRLHLGEQALQGAQVRGHGGWRYFAASAPSPPATRASAHSARLRAVKTAATRAPSRTSSGSARPGGRPIR